MQYSKINLKKAKEVELKFKKQALTVKLNTAKVQGKTNKLLREFLYLLLDPRLVPDEDDDFAFYPAKFSQFAREATFYLGRGTSLNRPYVHERKDGEHAKCDKIEEINQAGYNITVFPVFSGLSPVETSAREAILIRTLGLDNLTNEKAGYLPEEISLEPDEISLLGNYWLFLAYRAFQHVGVERPFLEDDE
ncbi:ankyrin repeat and LEM [Tyrophagus putrescentiae]|nr:ankyrin repeat and LEM [Tyrophagus putrescentiae]